MSNTYTTTIDAIKTLDNQQQNYVVTVLFTVTGTDEINTVSTNGIVQFSSEPKDSNFTPYENLTQEIILDWINTETNNQNVYYSILDQKLEALANPTVMPKDTALPW